MMKTRRYILVAEDVRLLPACYVRHDKTCTYWVTCGSAAVVEDVGAADPVLDRRRVRPAGRP